MAVLEQPPAPVAATVATAQGGAVGRRAGEEKCRAAFILHGVYWGLSTFGISNSAAGQGFLPVSKVETRARPCDVHAGTVPR